MPEVMSIEVDEEFDPRPPATPFGFRKPNGEPNYGLIAGIAVAVVLVLLLIVVVAKPFSSSPKAPPVSHWSPKDPTAHLAYLDTYPADSQMVTSVQASLDSWAKYYTTGSIDDLADTFDLTGEQYAKLVAEQPTIAAAPEAGPPAVVDLGPVGKVERADNIFTVRIVIKWTKPGAPTGSTYKWDIDMKSHEGDYVLVTVRDTDASEKQPVDFCGAIDVVAGLDDSKTLGVELGKFSGKAQLAKAIDVFNIKLKAWQLLDTSVAGTDSQSDVDPIVQYYQNIVSGSGTATSLDALQQNGGTDDISENRANIEGRAKQECGADIAKK